MSNKEELEVIIDEIYGNCTVDLASGPDISVRTLVTFDNELSKFVYTQITDEEFYKRFPEHE